MGALPAVHARGSSMGESGKWQPDLPTNTLFLLAPPPCHRMVFFLEDVMACTKRLLEWIAGWLPRHFIGAILVSLPALAVYSHVTSEFETNIHVSKDLAILFLGSSGFPRHFKQTNKNKPNDSGY